MIESPKKYHVIVGLSGGVDSAVAALLLKQQGHEVTAVFMKNWDEDDDDACAAEQDFADARAVSEKLDIPLQGINFSTEYWDQVFENFLSEYRAGRTPNPDVLCNREIKFRAFLDYALSQGADFIATGHYARLTSNTNGVRLLQAQDGNKDQTYFLHSLDQEQLKYAMFPIGDLSKSQVRRIAAEHDLPVHAKKDSTGICFIGERRFRDFLSRYVTSTPGEIRSVTGKTVGSHQGLAFYTIGQRQGLGIGGGAGASGEAWYVSGKDMQQNILWVAQGHEHPALYHSGLIAGHVHWIGMAPAMPFRCQARIRHRQALQACELLHVDADTFRVKFDQAQWAVAPGQAVVFYAGESCLGGATIIRAIAQQADAVEKN